MDSGSRSRMVEWLDKRIEEYARQMRVHPHGSQDYRDAKISRDILADMVTMLRETTPGAAYAEDECPICLRADGHEDWCVDLREETSGMVPDPYNVRRDGADVVAEARAILDDVEDGVPKKPCKICGQTHETAECEVV